MSSLLQKPFIKALGLTVLILGGIYFLFDRTSTMTMPEEMDNMISDQPVDQSHRSYVIERVSSLNNIKPNQPVTMIYKIKDDQGTIIKDFDVVHEKVMHVITVRKDLEYFQHIHPEFNKATGEFTIPVAFATEGDYRIFADFTPSSGQMGPEGERLPVTIFQDVAVGNRAKYKPQPIGGTERIKTSSGYSIAMTPNTDLLISKSEVGVTFEIKKDGKLITNLQKYLGALGHTVVLREGDLQFIHAHPTQSPDSIQEGKVTFRIMFPEAGNYKLFFQFQHEGKITTSDFVVNVSEGVNSSTGDSMKGMQH